MRDRETTIQYYLCYGMYNDGLKCREHSYVRADQLEEVVVTEVKGMLQNPDLILAGLKSMDSEDDGGLAKQLARAEKVTVQTWWVESVESRWKAVSVSVSNQDSSPIFDLQTLGSPQV